MAMETFKEDQLDVVFHGSMDPLRGLLDSQRELFLSQVDQLQDIVTTQCKLTGVNPLSQEMAAGALSIKIGKRPRDLLNPKAIKYMHLVFSIKDAISKKECREISALFGVTVTQVREFFATQRARVRKFVRLSKEKAIRANAIIETQDRVLNIVDSDVLPNPVPLNYLNPSETEAPSCSIQNEVLPDVDESDRNFIESIFTLMRKENTFSGQVKLMEWILQIKNPVVLYWFLSKGGVMILATWLSQAAIEEQTSVLYVILKVLCHLPLHKALPVHMSAILQSVNKLRFYRISDISNRALILLSRWSKMFARSQAMKKSKAAKSPSEAQDEMLLKQSIGEVMGNDSWDSKAVDSEEVSMLPYGCSENLRKVESPQPLKLITASTDDTNKKFVRGVAASQTRARRKVQLVEHPGQKGAGRSPQVVKSAATSQSRPLSADDIQKAKMRAQFLQSKHGKTSSLSNESLEVRTDSPSKCPSRANVLVSVSRANVQHVEENKQLIHPSKASDPQDAHLNKKIVLDFDPEEPLWKRCMKVQIRWKVPSEIKVNASWSVGTGDNSKEVEVQKNRTRREKETIYEAIHDVPLNPKEPWDREMDYDDTLTPEIPIEQLPDDEFAGESIYETSENEQAQVNPSDMTSQNASGSVAAPDLELLAVLLKNPELVYALTAGRGGNLSNEETVKLLDMIKSNGIATPANLNGLGREVERKVEVSLHSPTPPNDPVMSGWRPDLAKNPFSRQSTMANTEPHDIQRMAAIHPPTEELPSSSLMWSQTTSSSSTFTVSQQQGIFKQEGKQAINQLSLSQMATVSIEIQPTLLPSLPQIAAGSPHVHIPPSSFPLPNPAASPSALRIDSRTNLKAMAPAVEPDNLEAPAMVLRTPQSLPASNQISARLLGHQGPSSHMPAGQPHTNTWDVRQGLVSNHRPSHDNQNHYHRFQSGPAHLPPGHQWERSDDVSEARFETWSPDDSPTRHHQGYVPRWNSPGPRVNPTQNYRFERSRSRDSFGYLDHRDNRSGSRRWHDRRR